MKKLLKFAALFAATIQMASGSIIYLNDETVGTPGVTYAWFTFDEELTYTIQAEPEFRFDQGFLESLDNELAEDNDLIVMYSQAIANRDKVWTPGFVPMPKAPESSSALLGLLGLSLLMRKRRQ